MPDIPSDSVRNLINGLDQICGSGSSGFKSFFLPDPYQEFSLDPDKDDMDPYPESFRKNFLASNENDNFLITSRKLIRTVLHIYVYCMLHVGYWIWLLYKSAHVFWAPCN